MKRIWFFLLGFATCLISLSLFSFMSSSALLISFGISLALLFFVDASKSAPFLAGLVTGLELLGTHRFGLVSLAGLAIYGIYLLFALQLRFTSLLVRFIVALLIVLTGLSLVLQPGASILQYIVTILLLTVLVSGAAFLILRASEPSAYELL